MPDHGADHSVHRHIEVGVLQVHILQNDLPIRVVGLDADDLLVTIDLECDTGIHVQKDRGVYPEMDHIKREKADRQTGSQ